MDAIVDRLALWTGCLSICQHAYVAVPLLSILPSFGGLRDMHQVSWDDDYIVDGSDFGNGFVVDWGAPTPCNRPFQSTKGQWPFSAGWILVISATTVGQ